MQVYEKKLLSGHSNQRNYVDLMVTVCTAWFVLCTKPIFSELKVNQELKCKLFYQVL